MCYTIEDKNNNLIIIDGGYGWYEQKLRAIIRAHDNHVTHLYSAHTVLQSIHPDPVVQHPRSNTDYIRLHFYSIWYPY